MKTKKITIALVLITAIAVSVYAQQYDSESDFELRREGSGIVIVKYLGSKSEVRIPPRIQNRPVIRIVNDAFRGCTSLTSVTIPASVTNIGYYVFSGFTSLTEINVAAGNSVYTSENGVLYDKNKTTLLQYPVGNTAVSFIIPNSVIRIVYGSFYKCASLTSVIIGNSVTDIVDQAFDRCTSLTEIKVTADNSSYTAENGILYNIDKTSLLMYPSGKIGAFAIPDNVTSIGNGAFRGCESLTGITIPDSVKYIGAYAFFECTSLTSITIQGTIEHEFLNTEHPMFPGNFLDVFYATNKTNGTPGTYTRTNGGSTWTKQ